MGARRTSRRQDGTHMPGLLQRGTVPELASASPRAREVDVHKPRLEGEAWAGQTSAGTLPAMTNGEADGIRGRVTRQGEEALGKLAQDLLENPLINGAIARAFEAREKASQAQEAAMGALNLPTAADIERLTRRVRSVSQRLEGIEDAVDRLDERLAGSGLGALEAKLDAIRAQLDELAAAKKRLARA